MPEFRQNMVSKEWVIIATERAKRPDNFIQKKEGKNPQSRKDETKRGLQESVFPDFFISCFRDSILISFLLMVAVGQLPPFVQKVKDGHGHS